ncbi:hypothetical protein PR048_014763 [Dryococelus australis]|uniref:ABC transporter domain-containing protein n=1 Tax=Dryococelus australis TaxID=614101 RepID=A0ABQ9HF84_9NEOP|nr:hypothetical protein PR048_014763 [Dryococelus australis]
MRSGGQMRRVSLAVALLHEPEVLILDEPTVGMDPVLRAVIWEHLLHLSGHCDTTIILTTHYIEEAGQAHAVGTLHQSQRSLTPNLSCNLQFSFHIHL